MKILIRAFVVAMLALSAPAFATPPTVIDVHEEPAGVSETHLYLLRVSTDNLGYYEASRVEIYLIAVDWRSGAEEAILIDRFVRSSDYSEDGDFLGYSIKRDEGIEPASPYQIITDRGAMPWFAVSRSPSVSNPAEITSDADQISAQFGVNVPLVVTREALQDALDRQSAFMVQNVADHPRSTTVTTRQYFDWREPSAADCRPVRLLDYWVPGRAELPLLMQVNCSVDEDEGETSLVVQLRPADGG